MNDTSETGEILKCNVAGKTNSTDETGTVYEQSNLSLILTIAIPCVIGLLIVAWILSCILHKCKKTEVNKKPPITPIELKIVNDPITNREIYSYDDITHSKNKSQMKKYCGCLTDTICRTRNPSFDMSNSNLYSNLCSKRTLTYHTPNKQKRQINYYHSPLNNLNSNRQNMRMSSLNNSKRSQHSFRFQDGNCYPINKNNYWETAPNSRRLRSNLHFEHYSNSKTNPNF